MVTTEYSRTINLTSSQDEFQDLYLLFTVALHAVFRYQGKKIFGRGLTQQQAQVLLVAQALSHKCTSAEIARVLIRQPHTISAITSRMQKKGLINKVQDTRRRNCVKLIVTEKGENAVAKAQIEDPLHRVLGVLTQEERQLFHDYLVRILTKASDELGLNRDNLLKIIL
jgi:DNA-binding MarR family transcriptional regulator